MPTAKSKHSLLEHYEEAKKHLSPKSQWNYAFFKDNIDQETKEKIEFHLNNCEVCRLVMAEIEKDKEILLSVPELEI